MGWSARCKVGWGGSNYLLLRLNGKVRRYVVLNGYSRKEGRDDATHFERFSDKVGDVDQQRVAAHLGKGRRPK